MSFLSKLGNTFKSVASVVQKVSPAVPVMAGLLPTGPSGKVLDIFNGTAAIIGITEMAFTAASSERTGPQKLAAAMPQISALLQSSDFMFDKKVTDPKAYEEGIELLTEGVLKLMQSVEGLSPIEVNAKIQEINETRAKMQGQYVAGQGLTRGLN